MRFPLLVPGGRFAMVTAGLISLAKPCNLRFHRCCRRSRHLWHFAHTDAA
jgi:hypothetical protein